MPNSAEVLVICVWVTCCTGVQTHYPLPSLLGDHPFHHLGPGIPPGPYPPGPPQIYPLPLRDNSHDHAILMPPPHEPGADGDPPAPGPPPPPPGRPSMPHRPPHWTSLLGQQRPMEAMVDITNELGVTVLQDYAYSRGNFAFSPYGVASVLIVLYEGARGESARQVHNALKLPWDRDVTRIGFRDIHRNLRSYFSHEGYLSGVTLSQSRTALLPDFRRVLRFYGYDVDMPPEGFNYTNPNGPVLTVLSDLKPTPRPASNQTTTANTTSSTEVPAQTQSTELPVSSSSEQPTTISSSTTAASSSTLPVEVQTGNTTETSSSAPLLLSPSSSEVQETTQVSESTPVVDNISPAASSNEVERDTSPETKTPPSLLSPNLLTSQGSVFPGILMGSRLQEQLNALFPGGLVESRENDIELEAFESHTEELTTQPATTELINEDVTEAVVTEESPDTTDIFEDRLSDNSQVTTTEIPTTEIPSEKAMDLVTEYTTMSQPEPEQTPKPEPRHHVRKSKISTIQFWTGMQAASGNSSSRQRRDVNDSRIPSNFPDLSLQLQNGMFDSHVATGDELYNQLARKPFLVDGTFEEPVPVMEYTATFPFAYIPRLHALALEFPLDDERYRLLLLLPIERDGLRQLLRGLGRVPLRDVLRALRPTRLHAVVPAFMVEGFVILTPTLQQLGIWDMFDPRRADLSAMTEDPELYVRNIEQAVTVVVKNYVEILDIQTRTTAARSRLEQFIATHPFLYFVMDSETQVSLMAGKVVDPLNSRIY